MICLCKCDNRMLVELQRCLSVRQLLPDPWLRQMANSLWSSAYMLHIHQWRTINTVVFSLFMCLCVCVFRLFNVCRGQFYYTTIWNFFIRKCPCVAAICSINRNRRFLIRFRGLGVIEFLVVERNWGVVPLRELMKIFTLVLSVNRIIHRRCPACISLAI